MSTRRAVTCALLLTALVVVVPRAASSQASADGLSGQGAAVEQLSTTITFSFEIRDLVTDHQFEGQKNSFTVTYEYAASLQGGPFDPGGHPVSADTFPYFQTVRDDIVDYVRRYPDRSDFYEVFASSIARHLMQEYPQFRWIELTIQVPAFARVMTDRMVTVRMARNGPP